LTTMAGPSHSEAEDRVRTCLRPTNVVWLG
jgi:hypothetical protein